MIVDALIATVEGNRYRLNVDGNQTAAIPKLESAVNLRVDFDEKLLIREPLKVNDKVLAYFEGNGFSKGYIIGVIEE